jgi:alkaline phosphatase D
MWTTLLLAAAVARPLDLAAPVRTVAFGSCHDVNQPVPPIWPAVAATHPDLWIWTGDIIYARDGAPPDQLRVEYDRLRAQPAYRAFRETTPIIGTWDDHDYGQSNGGVDYPHQRDSQTALLDFLDEPADTPRRQRVGVYTQYVLGPPGRQVDVFVLDLRSFRTRPGPRAALLGEAQKAWFEEGLRASTAPFKLIVSSTQLALDVPFGDTWAAYPDRRWLLDLLHDVPGVIVLSGDKHLGVIDRLHRRHARLVDITASGLTHHVSGGVGAAARAIYGRRGWYDRNFGTLDFDWDETPPTVRLAIHDANGEIQRQLTVTPDGRPLPKPTQTVKPR